jgi:predicted Kef-type K+ transport protein
MNRQRGVTAIGWLIILGLIAFFVLLTLRLAPVYIEAYKVSSQLKSLNREPNITKKSVPQICDLLSMILIVSIPRKPSRSSRKKKVYCRSRQIMRFARRSSVMSMSSSGSGILSRSSVINGHVDEAVTAEL